MQIYGVVYPNGFCGQWLTWMMQSHPCFTKYRLSEQKDIKQFIETNPKTGHYIDAATWTPNLDYNSIENIKSSFWPPLSTPLSFDDYYNLYKYKTDKIIFRLGPNHSPVCASLILDYIDQDINYILLNVANIQHRKILATRIKEYINSDFHVATAINASMSKRLNQIQIFNTIAKEKNIKRKAFDIGKLVFDADINEYHKLCDYTKTAYNDELFLSFQQEYYDQVWKYIIE